MRVTEINPISAYREENEPTKEAIPEGVGYVDTSFGPYNTDLLKALLPFRKKFITRMRWSTENSHSTYEPIPELKWLDEEGLEEVREEADWYDSREKTWHFAMRDYDTGQIMDGLRLTPVTSVEDSLSWSMLEGHPDMQAKAYAHTEADGTNSVEDLNICAVNGNLYDLTRLVTPDLSDCADPVKVVAGMMELFATAYGLQRRTTPEEQWHEIRWMFTGTEDLVFALSHLGIQHEVITSEKISEIDHSKSYFCLVRPEAGLHYIREQAASSDPTAANAFAFPLEHMEVGLLKANAL